MSTQAITLNIPERLFEQLRQRAEQTKRSVEEETLEVLATAVPACEVLPHDLVEVIEQLRMGDDDALWQAVQNQLAPEVSERMEALHIKRQREGLSRAESQQLATLVHQYERQMLLRAQAMSLLKQRGHDVNKLIKS